MREILYRGKCKDNGEWVEGVAFPGEDWSITICRRNPIDGSFDGDEVDPASVGQYIGLIDKNGTKIFEGDIARVFDGEYINGVVRYSLEHGSFTINNTSLLYWLPDVEIVGNVYDDPELLRQKSFVL